MDPLLAQIPVYILWMLVVRSVYPCSCTNTFNVLRFRKSNYLCGLSLALQRLSPSDAFPTG